ncbi:MAG: hypothetical protein JW915_11080 [Chitinispirillaceae bacterium]|nr:hypothetical protein [Chitinispirillaceae bacterium]
MTQCIDTSALDFDLSATENNNDSIRFITVRNSDSSLLFRIHKELITQYFSDVNDIDSLTAMRGYMRNAKELSNQCLNYTVIAAVDSDCRLLGATVFGLFTMSSCTFIKGEYTVVVPAARCSKLLEQLLYNRYLFAFQESVALDKKDPGFAIIQVYSTVSASKSDPLQRMWRLRGFKQIDFPFVQLPLRNELNVVTSFNCYFQPLSEQYHKRTCLTGEEMHAIVDACCTFRESRGLPSSYDEYRQMKLYIDSHENIPLCH